MEKIWKKYGKNMENIWKNMNNMNNMEYILKIYMGKYNEI